MNRLNERYKKEIIPALTKEFEFSTPMQVPRLEKIVLNCGVGEATQNIKTVDFAVYALTQITGQKPLVNRSKKAIAAFKLREGLPIGVSVTLRSEKMWDFLDRLISVALPRVRDFRGVPTRGFDGRGNYTLGLKEQIVFPEVVIEKLDKVRGMDITFVTTAKNDAEGRALLTHLGMPFRKPEGQNQQVAA
jgi:large subunit ribosomal protein L5